MPYGNLLADVVQSSTSGAPTFNNTSGVEIGQLCRAWVNYNMITSTKIGSFNVSSVTKNGTGDGTINFTTAMPDTNYAAIFTSSGYNAFPALGPSDTTTSITTTSIRARYLSNGSAYDTPFFEVAIFR
jgi:hypothetical protein